jgi:hypothetical protein
MFSWQVPAHITRSSQCEAATVGDGAVFRKTALRVQRIDHLGTLRLAVGMCPDAFRCECDGGRDNQGWVFWLPHNARKGVGVVGGRHAAQDWAYMQSCVPVW